MKKIFFFLIVLSFTIPTWAVDLSSLWERTKNSIPRGDSQKKMSTTLGDSNFDDPVAFNKLKKLIQDGENKIKNPGWLSDSDKEREILKRDLNTADANGRYPILFPIWQHDYQMTQKMLDYGANPNSVSFGIYSPLILAIERQDLPIVKLLLSRGADCNNILSNDTKKNLTPLTDAVAYDNIEIIKVILSSTTQYDTVLRVTDDGQEYAYTPLQGLVQKSLAQSTNEYNELIFSLIDRGANINATIGDLTLIQALCLFYDKNNLRLIEKLAEKGADCGSLFQYRDTNNEIIISTPLDQAVFKNSVELANLILVHLNKNQIENKISKNSSEGTVLSRVSLSYNDNPKFYWPIIEQLVQKGADLNSFLLGKGDGGSEYNLTAFLCFLISNGDSIPLDKVEYLLQKGADPNLFSTIDENGKSKSTLTAVHYAVKTNNTELLNLLEKYGGDLKLEDSDGKNALFYVAAGDGIVAKINYQSCRKI